jgi:hypothetical protein
LLDAVPRNIGGGRRRFFRAIGIRSPNYAEFAAGRYLASEKVITRLQPFLREITGSDDAYDHLLRLRNEAAGRRRSFADTRKASLVGPAERFLAEWENNKEQIADDKRSGVLMRKLREANGMSLKELADHFQSRGINCDSSKVSSWEHGHFPQNNAEAVLKVYFALASSLEKSATKEGRLAGLAGQMRRYLRLETERRKEKRRKSRGTTMGALVAVPAILATALLGGRTVPPSQRSLSTTKPLTASSPMKHRQFGGVLCVPHLETAHDLPSQGMQKDIGTHVEETRLKGLGKKLIGKIRCAGKIQGPNIG